MSDFGGKLRIARERRGTSLQQISASTKISTAALEALERNDISKLPGGIFSRSFVRSYAHEVGLDPDETVREFLERFQPSPSPVVAASSPIHSTIPEEESAFDTRQRIAGVVLKLALISIPLIVLVLYFTMRTRTAGPVSSAASTSPPTVATSTTPGAVPEAPPTPVPIGTSPIATAVATAGAGVTGIPIELHTTAECWVRVTADGKRVLSRLMKEGEKETLGMQNKAVIEVGNAGGLAFSINGRPGKSLGQAGQVRTVLITKDTIDQFLQ
jgi:cytoskeletal protein RodZ